MDVSLDAVGFGDLEGSYVSARAWVLAALALLPAGAASVALRRYG